MHVCCKTCLETDRKKRRKRECPNCKTKYPDKLSINSFINQEIPQLTINCPFHEKGCEYESNPKDMIRHLKNKRKFHFVLCDLECGETILNKKLEKHQENECSHRQVECQVCCQMIRYMGLGKHQDNEFKCVNCTPCPNDCFNKPGTMNVSNKKRNRDDGIKDIKTGVLKKDLAYHLRICKYQDIVCNAPGCKQTMKRIDLDSHWRSNIRHHREALQLEQETLLSGNMSKIYEMRKQQSSASLSLKFEFVHGKWKRIDGKDRIKLHGTNLQLNAEILQDVICLN
jgi:hypothetical protein